jgi:hypothetical protein
LVGAVDPGAVIASPEILKKSGLIQARFSYMRQLTEEVPMTRAYAYASWALAWVVYGLESLLVLTALAGIAMMTGWMLCQKFAIWSLLF